MSIIPYPGFIGPSNTLQSINVDDEETINWFVEFSQPGTPKAPAWLVPTPGLDPFVVLGSGPVTGIFSQDGRTFATAGSIFYEIFATQTALPRGAVVFDGHPSTISSNGTIGNQLFITSGGQGYIFNLVTSVFTHITSPGFPTPCPMGTFLDDYFIALKGQSRQFYISALADGLTWDPLDVGEVSQSSDNLRALIVSNEQLWLFGSRTTEIWADIGDPLFPFAPIPGTLIQQGIAQAFTARVLDNAVFWVSENVDGDRIAMVARNYTPQRVSTNAQEVYMTSALTLEGTLALTYQQNGHIFYMVTIPALDKSLCYDVSTQEWHRRALWDPTFETWVPHRASCHAFGFNLHLVGDRLGPAIYAWKPDVFTDGLVVLT